MRSLLLFLILFLGLLGMSEDRQPLQADFEHSASYRWLNKEVLDNRLLDDMESLDRWETFTSGAQQVVDARIDVQASEASGKITEMILTSEKSMDDGKSLRMRNPTKLNVPVMTLLSVSMEVMVTWPDP